MNIRQATTDDAAKLQHINDTQFRETRDYAAELQSSTTAVYLCEEDGKIFGISGLKIHTWNNTAWIFNVFVVPTARRQGIGRQLIERMVKEVKKFGVRCLMAEAPSSGDAPALFKACGFRKCGYNDRYYANNDKEIAEFYSFDL